MATTTLQAIRELMIDRYELGRRGTATAISSTAITDDVRFGGHSAAEDIIPGCYVRITSTGSDDTGTSDEVVTRLSSQPVRTTGVMKVDPDITGTPKGDETFELLFKPFSYSDRFGMHDRINEALQIIPEKLMVPITLVTDGDMLASGVTTWGTVSNAAAAKSAASFPYGLRELQVTNSAAAGYLPSAAIPVDFDSGYYLEATARVTDAVATATARLRCVDLISNVFLTVDNDNTTQQEPEVLASTVQTGSETERVQINCGADENSVVTLWSNVIFLKNGLREFTVQDRAEVDRLGKLFVATRNTWGRRDFLEIGGAPEQLTEGLWRWQVSEYVSGRSVWYEEFRKAASLSADADTTSAPVEHVAAIAAELLLQPLADQDEWRARYFRAARDSAEARDKYEPQRTYVNRAAKDVPLPLV